MPKQPAKKSNAFQLAAGQWWQIENHYLQISGVGKTLVEYKLVRKPGQRGAQPQMGSSVNVQQYLKQRRAVLVKNPWPTKP
jgi:hypothetical protein